MLSETTSRRLATVSTSTLMHRLSERSCRCSFMRNARRINPRAEPSAGAGRGIRFVPGRDHIETIGVCRDPKSLPRLAVACGQLAVGRDEVTGEGAAMVAVRPGRTNGCGERAFGRSGCERQGVPRRPRHPSAG